MYAQMLQKDFEKYAGLRLKFVRGAAEIHAAPVVVAGFNVELLVVGGAIVASVEDIDGSPQKGFEVGFKPRPRTQKNAGKAVRHERSVMIGAESPHGVSAENDPVAIHIDPFSDGGDHGIDPAFFGNQLV